MWCCPTGTEQKEDENLSSDWRNTVCIMMVNKSQKIQQSFRGCKNENLELENKNRVTGSEPDCREMCTNTNTPLNTSTLRHWDLGTDAVLLSGHFNASNCNRHETRQRRAPHTAALHPASGRVWTHVGEKPRRLRVCSAGRGRSLWAGLRASGRNSFPHQHVHTHKDTGHVIYCTRG